MSAGAFSRAKYESDGGEVYAIRVQPETIIAATNPEPAGAITAEPSAIANGSRRRIGVNARRVRVVFTAGAPAGYKPDSPIALPILTPTAFQALSKGETFTYLGGTVEVIGKTPEYIN